MLPSGEGLLENETNAEEGRAERERERDTSEVLMTSLSPWIHPCQKPECRWPSHFYESINSHFCFLRAFELDFLSLTIGKVLKDRTSHELSITHPLEAQFLMYTASLSYFLIAETMHATNLHAHCVLASGQRQYLRSVWIIKCQSCEGLWP